MQLCPQHGEGSISLACRGEIYTDTIRLEASLSQHAHPISVENHGFDEGVHFHHDSIATLEFWPEQSADRGTTRRCHL